MEQYELEFRDVVSRSYNQEWDGIKQRNDGYIQNYLGRMWKNISYNAVPETER